RCIFARREVSMKVAVIGSDGPLAQATRDALLRRGHEISMVCGDWAGLFPGPVDQIRQAIDSGNFRRVVLRSHTCAYGSTSKNPGMMGEDRASLLPVDSP